MCKTGLELRKGGVVGSMTAILLDQFVFAFRKGGVAGSVRAVMTDVEGWVLILGISFGALGEGLVF